MTVPDGAPKHIEWGDRMAQEEQVLASCVGTVKRYLQTGKPEAIEMEIFSRIQSALNNLDKVRDEIISSENLEEELHDLIYAVYSWSSSQMEPASLINQAQKAHRVLRKIVHVGDPSGG